MKVSDQARAKDHLEALAVRHRVVILWRPKSWKQYECHQGTRQIFVSEPDSITAYMGALHEIGHIVSTQARRFAKTENLPMEEAAAWAWALAHADPHLIDKMTKKAWQDIGNAWASHLATFYQEVD